MHYFLLAIILHTLGKFQDISVLFCFILFWVFFFVFYREKKSQDFIKLGKLVSVYFKFAKNTVTISQINYLQLLDFPMFKQSHLDLSVV